MGSDCISGAAAARAPTATLTRGEAPGGGGPLCRWHAGAEATLAATQAASLELEARLEQQTQEAEALLASELQLAYVYLGA